VDQLPPKVRRERYLYLDALRGIAAIYVLIFHIGHRFGGTRLAPGGFLAVDFFFVLSGVVLASAYEAKIGFDIDIKGFVRNRLVRLLPMSAIGVALGTAYLLLRWQVEPSRSDPILPLVAASLLNVFLLPKLGGRPRPSSRLSRPTAPFGRYSSNSR
jgi:peptidoglycan/LPS O-acetylase OafA/YrhL